MRSFFTRLRDAFRRRTIAREFDEEMAFHLAELEQRHRARGASPEEARRAAVREFGNAVRTREDLRSQAGFPTWDELASDVKQAWRGITRRPALAGSVAVILALGLGAATTIHGLIDTVFLRPLSVPRPGELHAVVRADPNQPNNRLSRGTVRRLEALLPGNNVAAYGGGSRCTVLMAAQAATRENIRLVNGSFFSALEVVPAAGRLLTDEDDRPGAPTNVVVISYAWAKKNFGAPAAAVGREFSANRTPVTIVGVLPESFREVDVGQATNLWFATALQPRLQVYGNASTSEGDDRPNDPDWNREERISWLQILVRLRPGSAAAPDALQRAWAPQRDDLIRTEDGPREREEVLHRRWQLVPAPGGLSRFRDGFHSTGWLLGGIVAVMLLLVCANVSGLLLVRSMSRHREIGVRLSLGAGTFRVLRLSFLEALILSAAGAVGGWILAGWLLPAAVRLLAPGQNLDVSLGLRSVLVLSAVAMLSAVFSALAPALWISRVQPLQALSGNRGLGRAPIRLGRMLVVAQFAIAVALVTVAAALGEELQKSLASDPGFERDHVVTAVFDPASAGYAAKAFPALLERLRATALGVPGVRAAGFSSSGILAGSRSISDIYVRDPAARVQQGHFQHDSVGPGYFGVVGVPLLVGRDLAEGDRAGAQPVALVNAAFAREVFGDRNPVGQVFGFSAQPSPKDWTVVGVVADVRMNGVREASPPLFYVPLAQWNDGDAHFMAIRFDGPPAAVQQNLRAAFAQSEPGLVFSSWKTFQDRMTDDLGGDVATMRLAAVFGGCAVLLAAAGIAGSLGYLVVLRQRELALRLAIGASPGRLLRSVLGDSLRLSALGGAIGLALAWFLPRAPAVQAILNTRPGFGPALIAALVALTAAVVAGWIPARRAARIDPILMLKSE